MEQKTFVKTIPNTTGHLKKKKQKKWVLKAGPCSQNSSNPNLIHTFDLLVVGCQRKNMIGAHLSLSRCCHTRKEAATVPPCGLLPPATSNAPNFHADASMMIFVSNKKHWRLVLEFFIYAYELFISTYVG